MRRWFIRWVLPLQFLSLVLGLLASSLTGCPLSCCDHEQHESHGVHHLSTPDTHEDESHHTCSFIFCSSAAGFLPVDVAPVPTLHEPDGPAYVQVRSLESLDYTEVFRPPIAVS